MNDDIEGWITDLESRESFRVRIKSRDPYFLIAGDMDREADKAIRRGSLLTLGPSLTEGETRPIVGVSIAGLVIAPGCYELLAPKRVEQAPAPPRYVRLRGFGDDALHPLRPGSTIVGGRKSGFFDRDGVILSAEYVGGAKEKFEDWAYLVASADGATVNWVPLDDINISLSGPERVIGFQQSVGITQDDRGIVDFLLRSGERELLDYLSISAETIRQLTPRQFEETVKSIYRNLGFTVEPMGRWNQADGGVDFIALSKSPSNDEIRTAIQCKASRNRISARPIRELAGVMPRFEAQQGIVVTTSSFTAPAVQEQGDWFQNIELTDRDALYDKIRQIMGGWFIDTTDEDGPAIELRLGAGQNPRFNS